MQQYHKQYKFKNGYGASVMCTPSTQGGKDGLFEIVLLDEKGFPLYKHPLVKDLRMNVWGNQTFANVADVLEDISELPPRT